MKTPEELREITATNRRNSIVEEVTQIDRLINEAAMVGKYYTKIKHYDYLITYSEIVNIYEGFDVCHSYDHLSIVISWAPPPPPKPPFWKRWFS